MKVHIELYPVEFEVTADEEKEYNEMVEQGDTGEWITDVAFNHVNQVIDIDDWWVVDK